MARTRGRTRAPSGPRGTLGTLLRTTLAQAGVVRDVLERGAREGRARLDDVRRGRRRDDALARLGEAVLEAVRAGELELHDLPAAARALDELDALDAEGGGGASDEPPWVAPGTRERFDRRDVPADDASGDGTVSSASWRARAPAAPAAVWRPRQDEAPAPPPREPPARERDPAREPGARFSEPRDREPAARPAVTREPAPRASAPREPTPRTGGGIQFAADDDDDDLAAYMHPDDVPPRRDPSDDPA